MEAAIPKQGNFQSSAISEVLKGNDLGSNVKNNTMITLNKASFSQGGPLVQHGLHELRDGTIDLGLFHGLETQSIPQ